MADSRNFVAMDGFQPPLGGASSGIDILRNIDSLLVKHRRSLKEVFLGFASQAKYDIFNDKNEQVLYAYEESDCCQRYWCAPARRFTLHVIDNSRQEIMRIHREYTCCAGCCWCAYCNGCRQQVIIESPPGVPIGTVTQDGSCWRMHYTLKDINDRTTFTILGPCCICDGAWSCCCENKFTTGRDLSKAISRQLYTTKIFGNDGATEIGAIYKKYAGYCSEAFTSADKFSCEVPMNLDVKMKAIVLGALFVIDFTNFAVNPQQQN